MVLRVAPVDAVGGQDDEVVIVSDLLSSTFGLRDDKVFHLVVSEGPAHAELTVDAIKEYTALGRLDACSLVWPHWGVLRVELHPASVLACQCRN